MPHTINTDKICGVGVGVGVGVVKLLYIMLQVSDCDRSAIFIISTNNCSNWPNSYQHPMQFDVFQTSSKC
jgi:hypothetical protein